MAKTIKAKFSKGIIIPMEKLALKEGENITITIINIQKRNKKNAFENSAGKWKGIGSREK